MTGRNTAILRVTPTEEQDRTQVTGPLSAIRELNGLRVEMPYGDRSYTGERSDAEAIVRCAELIAVRLLAAWPGFVLHGDALVRSALHLC